MAFLDFIFLYLLYLLTDVVSSLYFFLFIKGSEE